MYKMARRCAALCFCSCTLLLVGSAFQGQPGQPGADNVQRLLKARFEIAEKEADVRLEQLKAGRGDLLGLLDISHRLLKAEREFKTSKAEQLAALEAHRQRVAMIDDINRARFKVGTIPIQDTYVSQYHRLDAELMLERARQSKAK